MERSAGVDIRCTILCGNNINDNNNGNEKRIDKSA